MKRIAFVVCMMFYASLLFATDTLYKGSIGSEDINWGSGSFDRRTSTGSTIPMSKVNDSKIPVSNQSGYYLGDLFHSGHALHIYPANITGDNTGRAQGYSFGSSSYTDNGYFLDIRTKGPWVDVRAYGVSTSETAANNTTYLTSAIAAFDDAGVNGGGGGTLIFPEGTYSFNSITLKSGVHIIGMGQRSTKLSFAPATGDFITLSSGTTDARNISITDLELTSAANTTGWAIRKQNGVVGEFSLERFWISGFQNGIELWNPIDTEIGRGRIQGNGAAVSGSVGIKLGDYPVPSDGGGTTTIIRGTYITGFETGLYNRYCVSLLLMNPVFELNGTGANIEWGTVMVGPHFEQNVTYDTYVNGDGLVIIDGWGLDNTSKQYWDTSYGNKRSVILSPKLTTQLIRSNLEIDGTLNIYSATGSDTSYLYNAQHITSRWITAGDNDYSVKLHFEDAGGVEGKIVYDFTNHRYDITTNSVNNLRIGTNVDALTGDIRATTGDLRAIAAGRGVILTNAADNVTKRVRLNDAGDGLIFEAYP